MSAMRKPAPAKPKAQRGRRTQQLRRTQRPRQVRKLVEEPQRHTSSAEEFSSPERIIARIASHMREDNSVQLTLGEDRGGTDVVVLDPVITAAVLEVLRVLSSRKGYAIGPGDYDLTSQQAADILNVGQDSMDEILDSGEIPYTEKNGCRLVRADVLFAFKRLRKANAERNLTAMIEFDQKMGLI